ncbi:VanW family protein [Orenia marismortui]|uniref:Surface rod structure-forming protein G n=1 Tax=Orenia marismortui TaxID=46469 RepID=A0A4R8GTA6_9FIRM|nr:VanW family protein [Orenia marismortui]TDX49303.1 surface rod structure-forming protein G [Orenia marismortui]
MFKKTNIICFIFLILFLFVFSRNIFADFKKDRVIDNIKKYELNNIVATYTTYFNKADINRYNNIKLASEQISGRLIMPNEIFSFNKIVGPRIKSRGYKEALEIINGKFVKGIGGGVCQVSSTLYNSILLADLKVIERNKHSLPVSYVPLGRGATVYYGQIDFRFKNNTKYPIMIMANLVNNQLTLAVLGKANENTVEIITTKSKVLSPKVIREVDKSLELGSRKVLQSGKKGFEVLVRRLVKKGDKIIKDEFISKDIYSPRDTIIKINPKN